MVGKAEPIAPKEGKSARLPAAFEGLCLWAAALLVAGRAHVSETLLQRWRLQGGPAGPSLTDAGPTTMVVCAGIILTLGVLWLAVRRGAGPGSWRRTGLGGGWLLLAAGGVVGIVIASNRHTAFVGAVSLLSALLLGILLVQWLRDERRVRLLLCAVAATGVSMAYRCYEQHRYELAETLAEYQDNPRQALARHNIEPGTYEAAQFEQRILSQDVGGYFVISNSAASFFILALSATAALVFLAWPGRREKSRGGEPVSAKVALLVVGGGVLAVQLGGMALTKSKGGIGGLLVTIAAAVILLAAGRRLARRWRGWSLAVLVMVLAVVAAATVYGVRHGRLPSASMWVRWQYWSATGRMLADHGLWGVGPENYGQYYTRYMDPSAPEVVRDPHNVWLALWSQWGMLGLAGALAMVAGVWRLLARPAAAAAESNDSPSPGQASQMSGPGRMAGGWLWGLALLAGVTVFRLAVADIAAVDAAELSSIALLWFVVPGLLWLGVWAALWWATQLSGEPGPGGNGRRRAIMVLAAGLLGFLVHNSIDFAIFEPSITTLMAALAAVAVALKQLDAGGEAARRWVRPPWAVVIVVAAGVAAYWLLAAMPIARAQTALRAAQEYGLRAETTRAMAARRDSALGTWAATQWPSDWNRALAALRAAQEANPWDPAPWRLAGDAHLMAGQSAEPPAALGFFEQAIAAYRTAAAHDPARATLYGRLGQVCELAADAAPPEQRDEWTDAARYWLEAALVRHPGNVALLVRYGRLLVELNEVAAARAVLERALNIEAAFIATQEALYPTRTAYGRLRPAERAEVRALVAALKQADP